MTRAERRGLAAGRLAVTVASCLLVALASLSLDDDARAQRRGASSGARVRVSGDGRRISLVERGRAYALALDDKVGAARIEEAKLLFLTRRGDFTYLLIDVCGLSKRRPDDRQCGAGQECNVVWVKLDSRRRVADAKSELYESCWLPVTSEHGPRIVGRRMVLELENLREWVSKEVGYDAGRPEEGLTFKFFTIPKA
ncbi:MAG TPA: hypothetical protein VFS10_03525 [Pyrinomonadaceae bacterium]|nr:hypothetical protein [Pyrinomonadaceae bacterium]